jgi:hypothetical protein
VAREELLVKNDKQAAFKGDSKRIKRITLHVKAKAKGKGNAKGSITSSVTR